MAKKNHDDAAHGESHAEHHEAPPTHSHGTREIAVKGLVITIPAPYTEGHVINAAEANALNQTFGENIGNNFRGAIQKALEDAKATKVEELGHEVLDRLRSEATTYAQSYEFAVGGRGGSRIPVNPVEREMMKIATELVRAALRKKNVDTKALPEGKFDELVSQAVASKPAIREEAERRVKARSELADLTL